MSLESQPIGVLSQPGGISAILSPLRRQLLESLAEPDSATGLSHKLGIPRQKINYHLRKLEDAGLVELVEERGRRGLVERRVRVTAKAFVISPEVLGDLAANPDQLADRYSSAYLVAAASKVVHDAARLREGAAAAGKKLATLTIESDLEFASPADFNEFARELTEQIARIAAKYSRPGDKSGRKFHLMAGVLPIISGKAGKHKKQELEKNNDR